MNHLSPIDLAIIVGYFVLTVGVGLALSRKASKNMDAYFLGGRSLPWYLLGIAGMAGWFDLAGTMLITSFLFLLGPRGLFVEFRGGACLVLAFLLAYAGKWHRRSGCMTGAEWMTYRFGKSTAADSLRTISALVQIVSAIMMLAYLVRGASLFLGMVLPYPPLYSTIGLLIITSLYTVSSGFYGVVVTDLIQGVIVMGACVIISVMAFHLFPDSESLRATAYSVTHNPDWTASAPAAHVYMPAGIYEQYRPLLRVMFFYLLCQLLGGMGQGSETRYFAARSDRDCGLQSALQGITVAFRWPMMIGFAIMGIFLVHNSFPDPSAQQKAASYVHAAVPDIPQGQWQDMLSSIANHPQDYGNLGEQLKSALGERWQTKLPLVSDTGTTAPEQILPAVLLNSIPTGLRGLLLVAMFSAMMSAKNGTVNTASAFFVRDLYQNLMRRNAKNFELMAASYSSTLLIVLVGFLFGIKAGSINELWGWITMSLNAGLIAPAALRLYWGRCNAWGMFGGLLLGGAGAVGQRVFAPHMPEWQSFSLMSSLSFTGTIILSLLTAPTPVEVERHFYRTTRPFGLWGKRMSELSPLQQTALRREHRNDILTVPFAMLAQVTLFLMAMQVLVKSYHALAMTAPLCLFGLAGLYVFWWRNLPSRELDPAGPFADEVPPAVPFGESPPSIAALH